MASRYSNLHPIKFTTSLHEQSKGDNDDVLKLFQDVEDDSSETEGKQSTSWFENSELTVYKLFYLFFYAATALFAYLPLYYRNSLLLDHHHVGILMGIRPFCGFIGAPILGSFADKFKKYKSTLYAGLLTYIVVYLSITFVNGVPKDCDVQTKVNSSNTSTHVNFSQLHGKIVENQGRTMNTYNQENLADHLANLITQRNTFMRNNKEYESNSIKVDKRERALEKPMYFSENVKQLPHKRFVVVSENENTDNADEDPEQFNSQMNTDNLTQETDYGQYWLYAPETAGEDTWPIDIYRKEPPENEPAEEGKTREHIFMIILLLMLVAELIGSPIVSLADTATLQTLKKEPYRYGRQIIWAAVGFGCMSIVAGSFLHYTVSKKDEINGCPKKIGNSYKPVFYSCCALLLIAFFTTFKFKFRTYEGKENGGCSIFYCINHFHNVEYLLFAFLAFVTGLSAGLTDSFLFVHLIRLGATPLVLVVTTTAQSISKVIFLYLSPTLILKYGYFPIIYAGMLTSVVTFLCYSFLVSPWMVVPVELLSGLSSSCVWAALVSYVGAPPKIGATLQGFVHSLHTGLGRGIGGLFGGMILLHYGFDILFRSFSLTIVVVVTVVSFVRYHRQDEVEPIWANLWDYSPVAPYDTFSDEE